MHEVNAINEEVPYMGMSASLQMVVNSVGSRVS